MKISNTIFDKFTKKNKLFKDLTNIVDLSTTIDGIDTVFLFKLSCKQYSNLEYECLFDISQYSCNFIKSFL